MNGLSDGTGMFDDELYLSDLRTCADHIVGLSGLNKNTVLVTGATGMLGAFLVDVLMQANTDLGLGITVVACARNEEKFEKRFAHLTDDARSHLQFQEYDMLKELPESFNDIHADFVIHAAGNAYPSAFVNHPEETVRGNIEGTEKLLEYSERAGVTRFLYISSGEVYSIPEKTDFNESVLEKVRADGARTCYPYSKLAAEKLCLAGNRDTETVVARLCHTFGPGASPYDDRAHAQFARRAAAGEDIVLNSAGTQLRSYNYIVDAVSGILSVLLKGEAGQCIDICSPENVITIRGLADLMAKVAGVKVIVREPDANEKRLSSPITRQVLCADDLCSLGWKKAFDLESGTRHYLGFLKNGF